MNDLKAEQQEIVEELRMRDMTKPKPGCQECGEVNLHLLGCFFDVGRLGGPLGATSPVLDSERADAAVHQVAKCRSCDEGKYHDFKCGFNVWRGIGLNSPVRDIERLPTAPRDQHVAPKRIWIDPENSSFWNESNEGGVPGVVEYLAVAPIREALEACPVTTFFERGVEGVMILKSDWDALVKNVKGNTDEQK